MIFYFTASGNSLYVAKELGESPISIARAIHDETPTYKDKTIGIVTPTYGGELPHIVRRFIERSSFECEYLYLVATYGKEDSVIAEWSYYFAKTKNVHFDYAHTIKMVDNFLPGFDMEEELAMDKHIPEQLAELKAALAERKKGIPHPSEDGFRLYDMVSRRNGSMGSMPGSMFKVDSEKCIGCEVCTKVCPVANISLADGKAKHAGACEMCLACAHNCPQKAITIIFGERNASARYRNPNVSVAEIIAANEQK